jgi:hypothetical protein
VFFLTSDGLVANKMDADGGNKTALPEGLITPARSSEPSHDLHGGQRWWLCPRPVEGEGVYPDGVPRYGLFAVPEDGLGPEVLLAYDPSFQPMYIPSPDASYYDHHGLFPRWTLGDGRASWAARKWVGDRVVDGGIYTIEVTFDANGTPSPVGGPSGFAKVPVDIDLEGEYDVPPYYVPPTLALSGYDWSPDGNALVLSGPPASGLEGVMVWDPALPNPIQVIALDGAEPRWSPDGAKIAFHTMYSIDSINTINPDGSDRSTIAAAGNDERVFSPIWSPASGHLVYTRRYFSMNRGRVKFWMDVYRVGADGSGDTNLTKDTDADCRAHAWRSSGESAAAAAQTTATDLCPSDELDTDF